ncbi:MAG: hypothetical protein F6K19_39335 [Cyanothece sp. SIO1E1]|nr:hypothetical protein [Cyanothece sp. SIO1E1]
MGSLCSILYEPFISSLKPGYPAQRTEAAANQLSFQGDFVVQRQQTWAIQRQQLKASLNEPNLILIDARELREYTGATPYGEQRGGHIPGAIHLHYKELMDDQGELISRQAIETKLQGLGIQPNAQIVIYCTGGIRSGWLTTVLVNLGFQVKNYAGSMWEWSAAPAEHYPIE